MRASATPTGKSISVSVRVMRAVRAVRAGEARQAVCEREAMISPKVRAAGRICVVVAWRVAPPLLGRCPSGALPVPI